ncbi:MAG: NAD-dependent epimerase/dehydratase family protein [Pseudomonadota bacterium]
MRSRKQIILVTGAGGFVGRTVCAKLREHGHEIRAITRNGDGHTVVADLAKDDIPQSAFEGVTILIHMAASLPGDTRDPNGEKTTEIAQRVAGAAKLNGVKRVIHLSSIAARIAETEDASARDYGLQKLEAERVLEKTLDQTQIVTLRPPLIYGRNAKGSFATLCALVARGMPLPLGAATQGRSYLSLNNLASLMKTIVGASDRKWRAADGLKFEPHDGAAITTHDLALMLANAMDIAPRTFWAPPILLKSLGSLTGKRDQVNALFESLECRETPSLKDAFGFQPLEEMPESLSFLSDMPASPVSNETPSR